jgi:hypothetical protein
MRRPSLAAAAVAAALFAAPTAADWLVTLDGGRVETRGAWKVKGKLVVFTRADGQLASLRIADVDWAASERATAAAAEPPKAEEKAPPEPKKESRWVLTDSDFRPAPPRPAEPEEKPAQQEMDDAGRPRVPVTLEAWERKNHPDGLEIAGTLRNPGNEIAAEIGVTVRLYDETGALVATGEGRIAAPSIGPGAAAAFRAAFPGVYTYAEAKFDVRGFGLRLKAAPEEAPASTP